MRPLSWLASHSLLAALILPSVLLYGDVKVKGRYERTYALVVGIGRFASHGIPELRGPEIDARGFLSIITDKNVGIVDPKDARLLLNESATKKNIIEAITRIRESLKENENFIFYFSGHASTQVKNPDEGHTQLVPYDYGVGNPESPGISFENEVVPLAATDSGYFIFVSDGCSFGESVIGRIAAIHPKVGVLSASKPRSRAYESEKGEGVMTGALLKALSDPASDLDGDGLISLEEAHNRVYREVLTSTRDWMEYPTVAGDYVNEMILGRVSKQALERRQTPTEPMEEGHSEIVTLTWQGQLEVQRPLSVILNGVAEPNLEVREDNARGIVTFLGDGNLAEKIKSGANSLAVVGKQKIQAARDSFVIYKEEKGNLLLAHSPFGHSYAVVVALSDYSGSGYPDADGVVDRAKELATDLSKQGFEIKPFYNKDATTASIDSYLREDLGPKLKPDDRVLIYYGGHGETLTGPGSKDVGYLVTAGTTRGNVQQKGLPMRRIRSEYMDLLPAKHVLFLIDACFSGLSLLESPPTEAELRKQKLSKYREINALASERTRAIITAGRKQDRAINENGGIFTRTLRDAMRGAADLDNNGVITFKELYCYLWTKVGDKAREEGHEQQPQGEELSDYGSGSFIFIYR